MLADATGQATGAGVLLCATDAEREMSYVRMSWSGASPASSITGDSGGDVATRDAFKLYRKDWQHMASSVSCSILLSLLVI